MSAIPLALLCALVADAAAQAPSGAAVRLVPGQQAGYPLAPGGVSAHELTLEAGQFARLTVVQEGVDVAVALVAPDGARTHVDVAHGPRGREPVSVLARASGTYRIEIRAGDVASSGRYTIEAGPAGVAGEQDRLRERAERALAEGVALVGKGAAVALAERGAAASAIEKLTAALAAWRALADRAWELETLLHRAAMHSAAYSYRDALADASAALALTRQLPDTRAEARGHLLLAGAYHALDDYDRALESSRHALALAREVDDRELLAQTLAFLGWVHSSRGEPRKHVAAAREVLALRRHLGQSTDEAWALVDLASAHANAVELDEAVTTFRAALAIFRATGDHEAEAVTLQSLGAQYAGLGDYPSALAATEQALAHFRAGGQRDSEAVAYLSLGSIHLSLGDARKALEFLEKALPIYRELGVRRREASTHSMIGAALNRLKDYEAAARHLEEALRLSAEMNDDLTEITVLLSLGEARFETGGLDAAREHLRRAAERSRASGLATREARALSLQARIASESGQLGEARTLAEAALEVLERFRSRLTSPGLRATFVSSVRYAYEVYVDTLMRLHRQQPGRGLDERALEASEMSRGRGLLDLLAEGAGLREAVATALLEEERAIQDRLGAALDRQLRLSRDTATREEAEAAGRAVQSLASDWEAMRDRIRATSPRFAELRDPSPSSVAEIRSEVLDRDTVLLEYALGETRSFLWVLSPEALTTYELPPKAVVEEAAREAYERLAEPHPRGSEALTRLSRMIVGPVGPGLTAKRLLVVPDGALHYVPIAALPHPDGSGAPMLSKHEVISAPSASVVALLRREGRDRRQPVKALAVFADAVFDKQDERLRAARTPSARPASAPLDDGVTGRALRGAGLAALQRLPFTRREAGAILSLVSPRERKEALGFDASRAVALAPELADYRIVHFATHGFFNTARPELSGIVLSLVDRNGQDVAGLLTAADVFNLRLNADTVVLSGCRTALGRELRGEGLMGLSRAFMYAGAQRVVASLWKVDDAATAALMTRFYRGVLTERLPPSAALRAAQLDLMRQARFRDPFYWAGFQLHGEWR